MTTLTWAYEAGHVVAPHFHEDHQLVYALTGAMTIETPDATWLVPAHRGVWVPARTPHSIAMSGDVDMRTLYFAPRLARDLVPRCFVLSVTPLLREVTLRACELGKLRREVASERRLVDLALDEIRSATSLPLDLPLPTDARALSVARGLLASPNDEASLTVLGKKSGASARTIERLFASELGMSFGRWRQQLRLATALRAIAGGASVTNAALDAGYSTPSAFIVAFKKTFGQPPRAYVARGD